MTLSSNLKRLLKERDLTLSKVSRATGVAVTTLSGWTSGLPPRRMEQVKAVAEYLELTLDELAFGETKTRRSKSLLEEFVENDIYAGKYEVVLRKIKGG